MKFGQGLRALGLAAALVGCAAASASTVNYSFRGSLADDSDVQLFSFTADGSSTVRLITYSYAGGTQADGTVVAAGGFDPILALFDSTGALIGQNDDAPGGTGACGASAVRPDPVTGEYYDTCLDLVLAAGSYTVSVMQYDNFAVGPNLANGFVESAPNFTASSGCSNGRFCDVAGTNRTADWAFDILNVLEAEQQQDVPEPGSLALIALALAGAGAATRRRRAG